MVAPVRGVPASSGAQEPSREQGFSARSGKRFRVVVSVGNPGPVVHDDGRWVGVGHRALAWNGSKCLKRIFEHLFCNRHLYWYGEIVLIFSQLIIFVCRYLDISQIHLSLLQIFKSFSWLLWLTCQPINCYDYKENTAFNSTCQVHFRPLHETGNCFHNN